MKILNLLSCGFAGGIETLCNNIDKYSNEDNYWVFLFRFGEIAEEIEKRNKEKVRFLGYSKVKIWKYLCFLDKYIKENNFEIVTMHHNGIYCNFIFYYLKKRNPKVKFVRFLHSCYEDKYSLRNKWLFDKIFLYFLDKTLKNADLIISVSKAVKESYDKKFNIDVNKNIVIYNGIDIKFYEKELINKKYDDNKKINVIYIGRLVKVKGVDLLITAVKNLLDKKFDINLTIVGDGVERENLEKLIIGYENKIKFVGKQMDVIEWLDKSDVFVYPSVWKEAFGISVVEAMSRGCITIGTNLGGLPEIIENNKSGYLFDGSIEHLEKILINIIELDKDNKELMLKNAINTSKRFSIKNTINYLNNAYNNMIIEGSYNEK